MQLDNKKVLVYGAAKSGISAANLLQKLGAFVLLYDCNTNLMSNDFQDYSYSDGKGLLLTGILTDEILSTVELVVISPGVSCEHPDILRIKERNIPIWGEVELAFRYTKGRIIGITGTNGKTTTTTLVGKIMKTFFSEVYVVGNIGNCYSDIALQTTPDSVVVIELSSFQLETIIDFKPKICTILNITPDHLDRHHTMEAYIAAKEQIFKNQTHNELCILNYEDEVLREMALRSKAGIMFFSSKRTLNEGLYLEDEEIYFSNQNGPILICNVKELHVLGRHNYENIMAAVGIALAMGIPLEYIRKAVLNFKAVEHRIEYVTTIEGVTYYNDSKGTNPDASIKAIQAMQQPTILIAGGYDKKADFDAWVKAFDKKVKHLILIGQTKKQIARTARKHGFVEIVMAETLKEAVTISKSLAVPGDAVLLSPACASWGMFKDFEERGNLFKQYVSEL